MKFRTHEDQRATEPITDVTAPQESGLGAAGAEFLAAADEAIARVLSGNAESFLRANRQQGGQ